MNRSALMSGAAKLFDFTHLGGLGRKRAEAAADETRAALTAQPGAAQAKAEDGDDDDKKKDAKKAKAEDGDDDKKKDAKKAKAEDGTDDDKKKDAKKAKAADGDDDDDEEDDEDGDKKKKDAKKAKAADGDDEKCETARAEGASAERTRWATVMASPAVLGRMDLACSLLTKTEMNAADLLGTLDAAPQGRAAGGLHARMAAERGNIPTPGPGGGEQTKAEGPKAAAQAIMAAAAKARGETPQTAA